MWLRRPPPPVAFDAFLWSANALDDEPARRVNHKTTEGDTARPRAEGDTRPLTILMLFLTVMAALAVPILTHPLPPLTDYVNNLARAHVIATIGSDADFQRFYTIEWRIIPNLMMDLAVPVLNRFMSIYLAGQVFTLAAFVLTLSGTFALNRALFGRWSVLPIVAGLIIYNEVLLVGVMNYVFGIGLALWALAVWIVLRERPWPWRFAASTLFVVALFFCHLFALGLYGLGLLAFESHRLWAARREPLAPRLFDFVASGAPFLAAAGLLLASPTMELAGELYWEPWGKFQGLLLAFTVYYHSVAAVLIAAIALAVAWLRWRGLIHLHPVGWALLLVGGVIYLAMPRELFATHLADQRLPIALAFMLIACTDIDLRQRAARHALAALFLVLLAVRLAEVQISWNTLAHQTSEFLRSARSLERGARVLVVHGDRAAYEAGTVSVFGLLHAASLATVERSALVSTEFVVTGKHVLQVREPFRRFVNREDRIPPPVGRLESSAGPIDETETVYWSQWPRHFDYVYVLFTVPGSANPAPNHLALTVDGPGFQLYRVIRRL
jgi:hypothetical protein